MIESPKRLRPLQWEKSDLILLDQTRLPLEEKYLHLQSLEDVWEAIKVLRVRGAPAIGIAAAFGMCLGLKHWSESRTETLSEEQFKEAGKCAERLNTSRPTAVNLRWALERILNLIEKEKKQAPVSIWQKMVQESQRMMIEDDLICQAIGRHGLEVLCEGQTILTHCNAGGLATAGYGTALAPVYAAQERGWKISVFADETRPLLQGARLTAYELHRQGIEVTLICDNMAAVVMAQKKVSAVIVGADRVAANGDFANKIGTYGVSILAKEHEIPFYCAVPLSTFDMRLMDGAGIPIEERESGEITCGWGKRTAPEGIKTFNPSFDVTPHANVTAFITEKGVIRPPFTETLRKLF